MSEGRPLEGKRVVVTRAPEQAGALTRQLEGLGAEVLLLPVVCYEEPLDPEPLREAIANLEGFDWLIFTSQNAVRFFANAQGKSGGGAGRGQRKMPKIAAVGPATVAQAEKAGWKVDFVASRFEGRTLAAELGTQVNGCTVLLPRSDRARPAVPRALRESGAKVTEVTAYRTTNVDLKGSAVVEQIRLGKVDVIAFASPSAFHAFSETLGPGPMQSLSARAALAAIGPVTAEAIREAGMPVPVIADESTASGLADAIVSYFVQRATSGATSR